MPDQTQADEFLTPAEFRAIAKVTDRTLIRWRISGRGPTYYRFGDRLIRYKRSAVDAWMVKRGDGVMESKPMTATEATERCREVMTRNRDKSLFPPDILAPLIDKITTLYGAEVEISE